MFVRVFATGLVRIQHRERGRGATVFVREVVIRDDHVEVVIACPVKRFVCANAAIDADDEFVTVGDGVLECGLLNAVTFSEAMRDMKARFCAKQFQRTQQHGGAGGAVNVVISVDQNRLTGINSLLET